MIGSLEHTDLTAIQREFIAKEFKLARESGDQECFPSNSDQKVRTCQLAAHNRIYLGLRSQAAAATTGPASARAAQSHPIASPGHDVDAKRRRA